MKKYIGLLILSACMLSSCLNDGFMDKSPLNQLTDKTVFTNSDNFKSYLWKYYTTESFLPMYNYNYVNTIYDLSDNSVGQNDVNDTPKATWDRGIIPTTGAGWDFSTIRGLNMALDQIDAANMTIAERKHWRSVGYFFKALDYIRLVTKFGDVPWLEHYITDADKEELYAPRTNRKEVSKKIMGLLSYAKDSISTMDDEANTINKHCVNALISRFGLFEGTWEKYHGISTPEEYNVYLQASLKASTELMVAFPTLISSYDAIFNSKELAGKPGIILYHNYITTPKKYGHIYGHNCRALVLTVNATADLIQSYLCTDGKPIWTSNDFPGDKATGNAPMYVEFQNRDRRLYYTVVPPYKINNKNGTPVKGNVKIENTVRTSNPDDYLFIDLMDKICKEDGSEKQLPMQNWGPYACSESPHLEDGDGRYNMAQVWCASRSGYYVWKYYNTSTNLQLGNDDTDIPIFRMGEVLVNHAEAAWELGKFDQGVADASINKLRIRAHIAPMTVSNITAAFDPMRDQTVDPVLWEIRRERRVELMAEGLRFNDLCRWKKGDYMTKPPKGVYVTKADLENERHLGDKADIKEFNFAIDGADAGRIIIYGTPKNPGAGIPNPGWLDKYYLSPLPINDLNMNDKLKQNPGWGKTNAGNN